MRHVQLADQSTPDHVAERHRRRVRRGIVAQVAPLVMLAAALAVIFALVGAPDRKGETGAIARTLLELTPAWFRQTSALPTVYNAVFQSHARALAKFAPHVPLVGPAVADIRHATSAGSRACSPPRIPGW